MKNYPVVMLCLMSSFLVACGSSGGGGGVSSTATVSGTVSAPGGSIAFFQPHGLDRMLAALLPQSAYAGVSGTTAVAAGIPVKLIEVDSSGTQVGADIATGTTTSGGGYSLSVPAGFTPGPQYIVRATDSTSGISIDARVTSTSINVDPVTNTASGIITSDGILAKLTTTDADYITDAVESMAQSVDPTVNNTMNTLTTALTAATQANIDASNVINSMSASGSICGTVTDGNGAALQNIGIVVRDYSDWVTRAKTMTDANGNYCVHVPVAGATNPDGGNFSGDYIVGAINATGLNYAASEWWTNSGGAYNQFSAGKVSVTSTSTVTANFQLSSGGRIAGTIYATDGTTTLENIQIVIRDFKNDEPVAFTRTKPDGTFRINLTPGTYTVTVRNFSLQAYAGGVYNGPASGTSSAISPGETRSDATPLTVAASTITHTPMKLAAGAEISGQVTDGTNAQPGTIVRFFDNAGAGNVKNGNFVDGRAVNKVGKYRIWLQPGTYSVWSRGQINYGVAVAAGTNTTQSFTSSSVHTITATLQDGSSNPISQAKVFLYDAGTTGNPIEGYEVSNSDGTVTAYATTATSYFEIKLDGGETTLGTSIYDGTSGGTTQLTLGTAVNTSANTTLNTVTVPSGGELTGTVTDSIGNPVANAIVQVRNNGLTNAFRFTQVRTNSDGSYSISLPAVTYSRVCVIAAGYAPSTCTGSTTTPTAGANYNYQDNVAVAANSSTTLNIALP